MAGSITPYQTAHGKRYRVRYRKPDKTQTDKRGFKTKKEAELFLASVTVAKAVGDYIDPALARITVAQLSTRWLEGKKPPALKPSAYEPLEISWRLHVEPQWGDREIASIVPSEVQAWVTTLAGRRSPSTVLRALGVLAGILDMAVKDRRIPRNPARGLDNLPRKGKRKTGRAYLTHDQVHRLAAESAHPTLVLTLAYTGLRWGEATALRVRHVNLLRRRLHIEENAVQVNNTIHVGTPKTHEIRTVPFPAFLSPHLEALCAGRSPDSLLFGDGKVYLRPTGSGTGWFEGAVARVRDVDPDFPRITPHDLRHTAASLAVQAGAHVKAIQRMLGHASAAMTLDTYADLFDDDLDAVAGKLDEAARAESVGKMWASAIDG